MSSSSGFRLRRLLDLRRRQEETARSQLASSLHRVSELSDEVKQRSNALERVLRGTAPGRKRRVEAIADAASTAILAARAAEASAIRTTDEIRNTWRRALRRVDGLERVEQRVADAAHEAERRAERSAVDEVVSSRARPSDRDRS